MDVFERLMHIPVIDTHEHLRSEDEYVSDGPDVLQDLFANYVRADLVSAGMEEDVLNNTLNTKDLDLRERWERISPYWIQVKETGYGRAVRRIAKMAYGIDEISGDSIEGAQQLNNNYRQPGMRKRILIEKGNISAVHINHDSLHIPQDDASDKFFFYDLRCYELTCGKIHTNLLHDFSPAGISDLVSLDRAIEAYFESEAAGAIAIKMQYAYERNLRWEEPEDVDVEISLQRILLQKDVSEIDFSAVGNWCVQKCVELAIRYNLPVKIHTGYLAGAAGFKYHSHTSPLLLLDLIQTFPKAHFVLFHLGYPYQNELIAITKRLPNVFVDMCWAWAIDPIMSQNSFRALLHSAPLKKIFVFGGDTAWPNAAAAYAVEMRSWLSKVLEKENAEGLLTEDELIKIARRVMNENQNSFYKKPVKE